MGVSAFHRNPAWPGLRLAAKRRDRWACVKCGSKLRLEVDHVRPVKLRPDMALSLDNLQTLCRSCHVDKTRHDKGMSLSPEQRAWKQAILHLYAPPRRGIF